MKKLMIAAAAAAMVGGAFAVQVADYRSTVKYVDMTRWTRAIQGTDGTGATITAAPFVKVVKITTLRGYVVYNDCACNDLGAGAAGNTINPAFLVVKSFAQTDNNPKILPAELLVKVIDQTVGLREAADQVGAEGYLFAGAGKGWRGAVGPWMPDNSYDFGATSQATRFLFGKYNDLQGRAFRDAWLDHAGFGSAWYNETEAGCSEGNHGTCLQKLMGYLIGGEYICHPNGFPFVGHEWFPCHGWLGTTDVVAGYWGMRRIVATDDTLTTADGAIATALGIVDAGNEGDDEDPDTVAKIASLAQVKACVSKMTNGKVTNLSFLKDQDTVDFLTLGIAYEQE